jgi:hypothetical protein
MPQFTHGKPSVPAITARRVDTLIRQLSDEEREWFEGFRRALFDDREATAGDALVWLLRDVIRTKRGFGPLGHAMHCRNLAHHS